MSKYSDKKINDLINSYYEYKEINIRIAVLNGRRMARTQGRVSAF